MKIEILGTGCAKCKTLFELTQKAVAQKGLFVQIEKVEDIMKIMEYGVTSTPALVINGVVKSSGRTLNVDEIVALLEGASSASAPKGGCGCGGKC